MVSLDYFENLRIFNKSTTSLFFGICTQEIQLYYYFRIRIASINLKYKLLSYF